MIPELIIDAYNLIHRVRDLKKFMERDLESAREHLIQKLVAFQHNKHIKITVVFDGNQVARPSMVEQKGIQVIYSCPPKKADDVIKLLLQKRKNLRNITVVSSDNEIAGFARSSRANTIRAEEFYQKYLHLEEKYDDGEQKPNMTETELKEWLDLFHLSREP